MPTVLSQTPISTNFNIVSGKIEITDVYGSTGAYPGTYSIPNTGIKGIIKATAPDGTVFYNNSSFASPDINGSGTPVWMKAITIPVNSDGSLVQGLYTVQYEVQITDGVNPPYVVVNTASYKLNYSSPKVCITQTADCISPLFTSNDITNYTVNAIAPTTLTRTHTLDYPYGSAGQGSPLVSSSDKIQTGTFYQGTQATVISTVLVYTINVTSGTTPTFTISDTITGAKEILVDCTFICKISCCIQSLEQRMYNVANGINTVLYEKYREDFTLVMSYVELAMMAVDCGQASKVNSYLTKIQAIAECTDGCNCTDTASLVTGLGGNSVNVVVASGGSPIIVTNDTVGGVTTYTVTLDPSFVNTVNDAYNTIVVAGNSSVTVTPSGSNPKTYSIVANVGSVQDRMECKVTMFFTNPVANTAGVIIGITETLITGTKFKEPTVSANNSSDPNWLNLNNAWLVSDFFTGTPDQNYKISMSVSRELPATGLLTTSNTYICEVSGEALVAGEFLYRFLNASSGSLIPSTNLGMSNNAFELTLIISE